MANSYNNEFAISSLSIMYCVVLRQLNIRSEAQIKRWILELRRQEKWQRES